MQEEKQENGNRSSQEQMQTLIEKRVSQARQDEMLEVYENLLQTIWNRIVPTLGRVTVAAIMERTLALTRETYPVISHLRVTPDGIAFDQLREQVEDEERESLRSALKELVADLIDILAMLTGDILVRHLLKEIEGKKP